MPSAIHADLVVFDGLIIPNWFRDSRDQIVPTDVERVALERMRKGGLTAASVTCCVWENFAETMRHIAQWKQYFRLFDDLIVQCRTAADIAEAKRSGRIGIVLSWQNTSGLEDQIANLPLFHELGVRIIQLTYNTQNLVGTGCYESRDSGLSDFGRDVIDEMNRLRIVVDLSHVAAQTADDALKHSKQPVCYSHIGCRSVRNHPRNKTDEQLRAVAERGGFVGVTPFPPFMARGPESTLEDFLDVIEHVIGVVGEEGVGIGSDFHPDDVTPRRRRYWAHDKGYGRQLVDFGVLTWAEGFRGYDDYENVTVAMERRGWSHDRIRRVMGANWVAFLKEIWGA